ncbi:MAG: phosphate ABC transporter permease subunit PstC [Porticoccaceae bacterium]
METANLLVLVVLMGSAAYLLGRSRAYSVARPLGGVRHLHSLPYYYGMRAALWSFIPAAILLAVWVALDEKVITAMLMAELPEEIRPTGLAEKNLIFSQLENIASGVIPADSASAAVATAAERLRLFREIGQWLMVALVCSGGVIGGIWGWIKISPTLRARQQVEKFFVGFLIFCASIAILTTAGIIFSVVFESLRFFQQVPVHEFVFGLEWSPQTAIRADQVGSSGAFGAVPLFVGTLVVSAIAMLVAVPVGLMSAIYLAEYARPRVRALAKPALEVLAGIPTVVYGFFAALTVAPQLRSWGEGMGLDVSSESALAAGLVMGVMIIPFVSSLADDVISAVPRAMRDGSLALGATQSETICRVIFPAALPGIVGGVLLAVSRAIGETMIVVMAAGLAANLTANPLESVTTVTVQIVTLLVGDQEFDSPKTLAAFALGLMLFVVTLILNIIALQVVKKYREQYE